MNRKNPSIIKYAVNQKAEVFNQEKLTYYSKSNNVKHTIVTKYLVDSELGNTFYMNAIPQCLTEEAGVVVFSIWCVQLHMHTPIHVLLVRYI